ncbi:MAG: hypothetical protein V4632_11585 [Pseudomonadota bacterium]
MPSVPAHPPPSQPVSGKGRGASIAGAGGAARFAATEGGRRFSAAGACSCLGATGSTLAAHACIDENRQARSNARADFSPGMVC